MKLFLVVGITGWISSILVGVEILLPYLLRPTRLARALPTAPAYATPYLRRMQPHYWLGYGALAVSFAHAWLPMRTGFAARMNRTGLWLATVALLLLFIQIFLGLMLQNPATRQRASLRSFHFWCMTCLFILVVSHIWLNG